MPKNPYTVLGVSPTATDDEIKTAYRRLAMRCHPDRFPDDPTKAEAFRELGKAYSEIDTLEKRRQLAQASGVSLRHGAAGAHTDFYRKMFHLEEGGRG